MEKEEQKWEQAEVEEQEEEESSHLVRKSRAGNDSKSPEIAAVGVEVSNGISETNGHGIQSKSAENGARNEEPTFEKESEAIIGEQMIEELNGVLENESEETTNGEQKIEELNGVPENEPEAINVEHKSTNLVFYDKVEGIWKCRICCWTYRNGSVCFDHFQSHNGRLHKLMSVKTLIFETEGVESTSTYFGEKQILKDPGHSKLDISSLEFLVQTNSTSAINGGDLKNNTLSSSSLQASQTSYQEHTSSYFNSSNEIESAEVDLINEDDLDETDYDVESVIQKQNTHDLYCPNCNSCITRRVILRKRKRRIRITDDEAKRNKIEAGLGFKVGAGSVREPSGFDDTEIRREDDEERGRGPAIFKCLSCFSIFIPTRKGFQLLFGDKSGKETVQNEQVPSVKKNWFISLFASNKQDTAVGQGRSSQTDVQKGDVGVEQLSTLDAQSGQPSILQKARSPIQASEGEDNILPFPRQKSSINGKVVVGAGDKLDMTIAERIDATMEQFETHTSSQLKESTSRKEVENDPSVITPPKRTEVTNGESSEDEISFAKQDGLKLLISSNKGYSDEGQILGGAADKEANQLLPTSVSALQASDVDGQLNISLSIPHQEQDVRATIFTDSVVENKYSNFKSSNSGRFYPTEMSQHTVTETKFELHNGDLLKVDNVSAVNGASVAQGKDAVITIDTQPTGPPQPMQGTMLPAESASPLLSATQIITTGGERTEARKEFEIEVVKSIVYGGLAESITSLSVVSSAVGGGAATLNILALATANLIGGLFIVCHNLWELKRDCIEEVANQVSNQVPKQRDRYKQLLGRRENFILHAVVAIISYIIFGLVPPLVYGFSFRKTNDKELKLLVVAASSLLCIVPLAIGRAYVSRPPKPYLQSVTTFVILGFMVSGVSYAAGILVERLLEKLGLFESSSISNLLLPEMAKGGSAWASY
ncbi:hypothetical protein BUALT_Bualt06G0142600 [Buddleja alternifolia]|uniref:C2H2-type domain-containing protein n=1 Tax=Buddleja alternifolia TaxID=168488 RepID=A0AAV6XR04_9LAMI|nr:hypothetical protein BUALT_Bualt06G0142600 [Buddleja alternifolia]